LSAAVSVLHEAEMFGVTVRLNGDKLRLDGRIKPPAELLERLKAHKAEIMDILRREEAALTSKAGGPPVATPATPTTPIGTPAVPTAPIAAPQATKSELGGVSGTKPPMSQPPLGISRRLAEALNHAAHYHLRFWFDEAGVLITQPPLEYRREVQAAERALMACRDEIKMICKLPERPKRTEDQTWVRAVADSARLGYRNWRED
jgi:hypothetical protein